MSKLVVWTLEQAAAELRLTIDQVTADLNSLPKYGDKYLVEDILATLSPALSTLRSAERQARTDYLEFRNAVLKGEQVETDPMEREVVLLHHTTQTLIIGSALSREKQAELYERLDACKSVVVKIEPEYTD